jgi:hypothetical protein
VDASGTERVAPSSSSSAQAIYEAKGLVQETIEGVETSVAADTKPASVGLLTALGTVEAATIPVEVEAMLLV